MCRECAQHPDLAIECRRLQAETLRHVYLFEELDGAALGSVLDHMEELDLEAEEWLFFRRDPAKRFFLVLEGDVALVRYSPGGDELIVAIVGPGELFEEDLVLVDDPRHSLCARALGPCRLASFDRLRVRRMLGSHPGMAFKIANTMHRRNSLLLDELERVTVQDAGERLVSFLASQTAAHEGLPLRFPKRVLASRLSIRPETLSRVLARLKSCERVREVEGCLLLVPEGDGNCDACEACPAELWGCPGPRRQGHARPSGHGAAGAPSFGVGPR